MQNKGFIVLWVIMAFLMLYSPLFAQIKPADREILKKRPPETKPFEGWTEEDGLNFLDEMLIKGESEQEFSAMIQAIIYLAELAASLQSEKMVQKILELPEFKSYQFAEAKVIALRVLKDFPGVREYVIQSLDHQSSRVQIAAASTLLSWGEEWELAAPVICKYEAYLEFQQNKDERALPLLEDAVKNGSWNGRISAVSALCYTYGDTIKYMKFALDIMMSTPLNTDDEELNRAKHWALIHAPWYTWEPIIPGLCRLAYDDKFYLRSKAVDNLAQYSGRGFQEAKLALREIMDNHPDENIREQAKKGLLGLEHEQE